MVCTPDVTRSLKFVIVTNVKRMKSILLSKGEARSLYTWRPGTPWKSIEACDCKYQWRWRVKTRGWVYDCECVACESIRRSQYRRLPFRSYSNSNLVTVRSGMRALPSRLKHVDSFTITHSLFATRYLLQMYMMLQVWYTVTAAGADASCISRVFFLLSSLYHRIHAHGSPQLPYRNTICCFDPYSIISAGSPSLHVYKGIDCTLR